MVSIDGIHAELFRSGSFMITTADDAKPRPFVSAPVATAAIFAAESAHEQPGASRKSCRKSRVCVV